MLNVIKMELHRLFRTKSLYITIGVCAGCLALFIMLTAALMNLVDDFTATEMAVSASDAAGDLAVSASDTADTALGITVSANESAAVPDSTNPVSFCSSYITMLCVIFVVIFTSIFIHSFYKDGYNKNVIACVRNRWYFQAAKAVCVAVYTALLLVVSSVVSIVFSAIMIKSFTLDYLGVFFLFLLGEFFLLNAIGLLSAFLTELTYSKVTAIVYIMLSSTSIIKALLSLVESRLSSLLHMDVEIWKLLPSLYHGSFGMDAPDTSGNGEMLLHAIVLSLVFMVIYNAAGAFLISRRDVK